MVPTTLSFKSKRKLECQLPLRESEPKMQEEMLKTANYFRVMVSIVFSLQNFC